MIKKINELVFPICVLIILSIDSWVPKYDILKLLIDTYCQNVQQWLGIFLIKSCVCHCD